MLKFVDLSKSQKRFVVAVINECPEYKTNPNITLQDCAGIYYSLRDRRTGAKGEKIGYPNWLFKSNKVERGIYELPVPTDEEVAEFTSELLNKERKKKSKKIEVSTELQDEAQDELRELQNIIDTDWYKDVTYSDDEYTSELESKGITIE